MSYEQIAPGYEAIQLGGGTGDADAFASTLNIGAISNETYTVNSDGSITVFNSAFGSLDIAVGDWQVSDPYWGTFGGWHGALPGADHAMTDDAFQSRFTAAA